MSAVAKVFSTILVLYLTTSGWKIICDIIIICLYWTFVHKIFFSPIVYTLQIVHFILCLQAFLSFSISYHIQFAQFNNKMLNLFSI